MLSTVRTVYAVPVYRPRPAVFRILGRPAARNARVLRNRSAFHTAVSSSLSILPDNVAGSIQTGKECTGPAQQVSISHCSFLLPFYRRTK
jgi:hypothetical protein